MRERPLGSCGEQCNWIGRSNPLAVPATGLATPRSVALGPNLYDGLSGIAVFLGELFVQTGEAVFGRTAEAAVACALRQFDATPSPGLGFYAGATGVAFAASWVWERTGHGGASQRLVELIDCAVERRLTPEVRTMHKGPN